MEGGRIIIYEREEGEFKEVREGLVEEGFLVVVAKKKEDIIKKFEESPAQILIIDFLELDENLLNFCYGIKNNIKLFVIALVENNFSLDDEYKVKFFELEDFIIKPFESKEVVLRVLKIFNNNFSMAYLIDKKYLKIDIKNYELYVNGKKKKAAPKEIELLYKLVVNENLLLTRDQLLDEVWGYQYLGTTRTVDVHIKRLRHKLEDISKNCQIETVWGVGYIFKTN